MGIYTNHGVGRRALPVIDTMDLKILSIEGEMKVMEVAREFDIMHKNLKTHLDRLEKLGLIKYRKIEKSPVKPIVITKAGKTVNNLLNSHNTSNVQ